jgi:hypothetical protein
MSTAVHRPAEVSATQNTHLKSLCKGILNKTTYTSSLSLYFVRAACPAHYIILYLVQVMMSGEKLKNEILKRA